jgi:hypothetical protein
MATVWQKALSEFKDFQKALDKFQKSYQEVKDDPTDSALLWKLFLKDTYTVRPTLKGTNLHEWLTNARSQTEISANDPDKAFPSKLTPDKVVQELQDYEQNIVAALSAAEVSSFTYSGFKVSNPDRLTELKAREMLEGIDYIEALFKKRGMTKLLHDGLKDILIRLWRASDSGTIATYTYDEKLITLNSSQLGGGDLRFTMGFVNEVFLHEFGHHVHRNLMAPEAMAVWSAPWVDIHEMKDTLKEALGTLTGGERKHFFDLLKKSDWSPQKAAKKLKGLDKLKFGIWLRTPARGLPLISPKSFKPTKQGETMFDYLSNPEGFTEAGYQNFSSQVSQVLGLDSDANRTIPEDVVHELTLNDPEMRQAVKDAIEALQPVTPYGRTNEFEDFAETFVAFVAEPSKLTDRAKFRMQQALAISGLYHKPIMTLNARVVSRFVGRCRGV